MSSVSHKTHRAIVESTERDSELKNPRAAVRTRRIVSKWKLLAIAASAGLGGLGLVRTANASDLTWDATPGTSPATDGAGTWLAANQWINGVTSTSWTSAPPDNAIFGVGGVGGVVTVTGNVTAGNLTFNSYTGNYSFRGTSGTNTITINNGILMNAGGGNVSLGNATLSITLGGTQSWTNNTTGNALTVSGAVTGGANVLTLDGSSNGLTSITAGLSFTGAGGLVIGKTGTLGTTISGGTITLGGTGGITINSGSSLFTLGAASVTASQTWTNNSITSMVQTGALALGANTLTLNGGNFTFSQTNTGTGNIALNAGRLIATAAGAFGPGTETLVFGGGELELKAAATTFTGKLDLSGASETIYVGPAGATGGVTHIISGNSTFGTRTTTVLIGPAATTNSNFGLTFNGLTTLAGNATFSIGTNGASNVGTVSLITGGIALGGADRTITSGGGGNMVIGGGIGSTASGNALTFAGTGNISFNAILAGNASTGTNAVKLLLNGSTGAEVYTFNGAGTSSGAVELQSGIIAMSTNPGITLGTFTLDNGTTIRGDSVAATTRTLLSTTNLAIGNVTFGAVGFAGPLVFQSASQTLLANNQTLTFSTVNTTFNTNSFTLGANDVTLQTGTTGSVNFNAGLTYTGARVINTGSGTGQIVIQGVMNGTSSPSLTLTGTNNNVIFANGTAVTGTTGLVTVDGPTVTFGGSTGTSSFTGGVTLQSGKININQTGNATTGPLGNGGTFTINGGTVDNTSGSAKVLVNVNPVTIGGNFSLGNSAGNANNNLTLPGPVSMAADQVITLNGNSTFQFSGGLTNTGDSNRTLTVNKASGNGTNTVLAFGGYALTGPGSTAARMNIVNGSANVTFNGPVTNGVSAGSGLTYSGTGTMSLTANNTFTGGVHLVSGKLRLGNAGALNMSGGTLTIEEGTALESVAALSLLSGTTALGTVAQGGGAGSTTMTSTNTSDLQIGMFVNAGTLPVGSYITSFTNATTFTVSVGSGSNFGAATNTFSSTNAQVWNGNFSFGNTTALSMGSGDISITPAAFRLTNVGSGTLYEGGNVTGTSDVTLVTNGTGGILFVGTGTTNFNTTGSITTAGTGTGTITIAGGLGSSVTDFTTTGCGSVTLSLKPLNNTGSLTFGGTGASVASVSAAINGATSITNNGTTTGTTSISGVIGSTVTSIVQNSTSSALSISGNNTALGGNISILAGTLTSGLSTALGNATVYLGGTSSNAQLTLGNFATANNVNVLAGAGNLTIRLNSSNNNPATFSGNVSLANDLTVIGNGVASNGPATFSGTFTGTGNVSLINVGSKDLSLTGSIYNVNGSFTHSGNGTAITTITSSIGSSVGSISQNSTTDTLILTGNNTYTGTTSVIAGGTLRFTKANSWSTNFGGVANTPSPITMGTTATLYLNVGGAGEFTDVSSPSIATILANTNFGAGSNLILDSTTAATTTAVIGPGASSSAVTNLQKLGTGVLALAGNNTYSGTTTLTAGTLQAAAPENAGVSGPFGTNTSAGAIIFNGGSIGFSSVNTFDYSSRFTVNSGQSYRANMNQQAATWGADLGAFGLVVSDSNAASAFLVPTGVLTLTGTNILTSVSISASGLSISSFATNIGPSTTAITISTGVTVGMLRYSGTGNETAANPITFTATGNPNHFLIDDGPSGVLNLTGNVAFSGGGVAYLQGTGTGQISGNITGTAVITKSGSGSWTLSGNNTNANVMRIQEGILSVSSINSVASGNTSNMGAPITVTNGTIGMGGLVTGAGTVATTTGQLTYTGTGETTDRVINLQGTTGGAIIDQSGTGLLKFTSNNNGNATFTATGAGSKTLTLQGNTTGIGEIAAAIVNNSSTNRTTVAKAGTGTWILSGNNSYSGNTTISGGKLLINNTVGSGTGNGTVTVNNGGTLGGNGTISGNITVASGGTIAAGNSVGILHTGNVSIGGKLSAEVDTASNTADILAVTGAVNVTGGTLELVILPANTTGSYSQTFVLIDNDAADAIIGAFDGQTRGVNDSVVYTTGLLQATLYYSFNYNGTNANTSALTGGNDLGIVFTQVPEPTSLSILGMGAVGLLSRRRRRKMTEA